MYRHAIYWSIILYQDIEFVVLEKRWQLLFKIKSYPLTNTKFISQSRLHGVMTFHVKSHSYADHAY